MTHSGSIVRRGAAALGVCLALALPSVGRCDLVPRPRLKVGVFLPQDSSLRDSTSDVWFRVGADVNLPLGLPFLGADTRLGIDYAVTGSSTVVPVTLTEVWQPSVVVRNPLYVGAGIGVWSIHLAGHGTTGRLGFRLLAGVDIGRKTFVEANYDFVQGSHGTSVDGLSLMIGTRF